MPKVDLSAIASHPYVEEDQEAQGAYAPLKGQPRQAPEHGSGLTRPSALVRLAALTVGGSSHRWRNLFAVPPDGDVVIAGVTLNINTSCDGMCDWGISFDDDLLVEHLTVRNDVDGIPTRHVAISASWGDPRFMAIDHVVVNTDDLARTSGAIEDVLGAPLRRVRDAGHGVSQGFHVLDNTIIEVVSGPHVTHAGSRLWGFVVVVDDLFDFARAMGPDVMTAPKSAVQPGRHISSVRSETALGVPVAFMSPRVKDLDLS